MMLRSIVVTAALGVGLVACGGGGASTPEGGGLVDQRAPAFTADPVSGNGPKTLDEAKGKVVILDFWATFCGPCKKSFPKYQEIVDQSGGQVVVIAVSEDDADNATALDDIKGFIKDTGVKFTVLWDKGKTAPPKYGVKNMPTSFIIDKAGVVKFVHPTFKDGEEAKIADEVKTLTK
jgi:thiol-disulfide isomerase/thioredoxin